MIPDFVDIEAPWRVLPPGIYDATMTEVENRFTNTVVRKRLFKGLKRGVQSLTRAGCKVVYLDGSFVTDKPVPGDFDACWEPKGVDPSKLDKELLDFSHKRRNQKQKYGGEFFPSHVKANRTSTFIQFFQTDRYTGKAKGIIRIELS